MPRRLNEMLARSTRSSLLAVGLVLAQAAPAQIAPEDDFAVDWITLADTKNAVVLAVVSSKRPTATTLDYVLEVLRTDPNDNSSVSRQTGLIAPSSGQPDSTSFVRVEITPGTRIEANVTFTSVQEGWTVADTIIRVVGPPPEQQQVVAVDPDFLEVDGLVADQTLTKSGQDFFQLFYQSWQPPLGASSYSILVEEVPWRGRQTLIQVSLNDEEPIYQQIVQPRYDVIEEMAAEAVQYAAYALQRYMEAQQNRDGEINEALETY